MTLMDELMLALGAGCAVFAPAMAPLAMIA